MGIRKLNSPIGKDNYALTLWKKLGSGSVHPIGDSSTYQSNRNMRHEKCINATKSQNGGGLVKTHSSGHKGDCL